MAGPGYFSSANPGTATGVGGSRYLIIDFKLTVEVEVIYLEHVLTIFTIFMLLEGTAICINSCRFVYFDVCPSDNVLSRTSLKLQEVSTRNFVGR